MILLLIFVLISGVSPGVGIELMLHIVTFFTVALMCHYELARDRPSTALPHRVLPADVRRRHARRYVQLAHRAADLRPRLRIQADPDRRVPDGAEPYSTRDQKTDSEAAFTPKKTDRTRTRHLDPGHSRCRFLLRLQASDRFRVVRQTRQQHARSPESLEGNNSRGDDLRDARHALLLLRGPAASLCSLRRGDSGTDHDPRDDRRVDPHRTEFLRHPQGRATRPLQPARSRHDAARNADQRQVRTALGRRHPDPDSQLAVGHRHHRGREPGIRPAPGTVDLLPPHRTGRRDVPRTPHAQERGRCDGRRGDGRSRHRAACRATRCPVNGSRSTRSTRP